MIGFNGHQLMKFYLPMKPIKWDFKIHILVDCIIVIFVPVFQVLERIIKIIQFENNSYTESIVSKLLEKLENTNRCIYFDSWYSSISLCKKLTEKSFKLISTIRNNVKNLLDSNLLNNSSKKYAYDNNNKSLNFIKFQ